MVPRELFGIAAYATKGQLRAFLAKNDLECDEAAVSLAESTLNGERDRRRKRMKAALAEKLGYYLGDRDAEKRGQVLAEYEAIDLSLNANVLDAVRNVMEDFTFDEAAFLLASVHQTVHGGGHRAQSSTMMTNQAQFRNLLLEEGEDRSEAREALGLEKDGVDISGDQRHGNSSALSTFTAED